MMLCMMQAISRILKFSDQKDFWMKMVILSLMIMLYHLELEDDFVWSLAEKEFYLFFAGFIQNYSLENVPGIKPPPFGVDDVHVSAIIRSPPMFEMILRPRDSS